MAYQAIICKQDDLLTVYVDRDNAAAPVYYTYDGGEDQTTPFQTADMPMSDSKAAKLVNDWIGE